MRITKVLFIFLLLLGPGAVVAQPTLYLEPRVGFGTFRMNSMKELQQHIIGTLGVAAKATDEFNPFFQSGLTVLSDVGESARLGVFYEFGSTGGRVAYKDYSGELRFDHIVNYNALGVRFETLSPASDNKFRIITGVETNVFLSRLKFKGYSRVFSTSDSQRDSFNSIGFGLKPYLGLGFQVFGLQPFLSFGYMLSKSGPFHVPGEPKQYLLRNQISKLEPDWSGLRVNLTVAVPIRFRKANQGS